MEVIVRVTRGEPTESCYLYAENQNFK